MNISSILIFILGALLLFSPSCARQKPDLTYGVSISQPFFRKKQPMLLYDDGHQNSHQSDKTYSPFVALLKNDGCKISSSKGKITQKLLTQADVLIIVNAKGKKQKYLPAFDSTECEVIEKWVSTGGSLLLVADHYPFGAAVESLSQKFGVRMFNGEVSDSLCFHGNDQFRDELVFSKKNGLLSEHPITQGIHTVYTFRGQSLSVPESAMVLLKLSEHAVHTIPDSIWHKGGQTYTRFAEPVSAEGYCQGLALFHGQGRVVILGEAAMLTAQVYEGEKFGINTPGNDNRQFVLNVMHWLVDKNGN